MKYKLFSTDKVAEYVERPNRFIVIARTDNELLKTHCPNPGRLREILLPGRNLLLEKSGNSGRKTNWTLAAAEYRGLIVPLISARSNTLTGELILPELYPDFTAYPERTAGDSRIDWLLEKGSQRIWIEVKACTLVEKGRAMFPDAPSIRAVKHLNELISLEKKDKAEVIFTVMNPSARVFSPNPHTDPNLCITLARADKSGVGISAVSFRTDANGYSTIEKKNLPIDLSSVDLALKDSGILLKIWKPNEMSRPFLLTFSRHPEKLSRAEVLRVNPPQKYKGDYRLILKFPIRGHLKSFDSIMSELSGISDSEDSGVFLWNENPVENLEFLDFLLDYRHRRVFLD